MTTHTHQGVTTSKQQPASQQPSKEEIVSLLRINNAKLGRLLTEFGNSARHSVQDGLLIEREAYACEDYSDFEVTQK
jgi:hypothetical protein